MKTAPVMTRQREAIVYALRACPGMSTRELAEACAMSDATADYHLVRLVKAGVVVRRRYGRALAHYLTGVRP